MTRLFRSAMLYISLGLGANAAAADAVDLAALREGDMRGLVIHEDPADVSGATFFDIDETELTLADFAGRHVLLNFWATWCAPCREEMPSLNTLQQELGGADFQVVTLATGRNAPQAIRRFFEEVGVTDLPMYRDPNMTVARQMAVFGLPITVILNPEGQEIARLRGDADWASPEALAFMRALIGAEG